MHLGPGQLVRLTAAKAVATTSLRWIPFFLFVLEDAFDTTTTTLTLIIGLADMVGLGTLLIARQMDQGREQRFLIASLILISAAGIVALGGTVFSFAVAFVLIAGGGSLVTVAGHTWLSRRVPFDRRGRAIGTFETAWAMALLIGAPIVALTIDVFGWRGPFVLTAIAGAVMAIIISGLRSDGPIDAGAAVHDDAVSGHLNRRAWLFIASSAATSIAGLATIVIVGTWLSDAFGVSTGEVGITAMAFGLAELAASAGSARFSDDLGKVRTMGAGLLAVLIGLAVMSVSGSTLVMAIVGLGVFFVGFEYSIVTSFSIVSEAAPNARGRALATNNAIGTLARGAGTVLSGFLYEAYGIGGPAVLSGIAAVLGLVLLVAGGSERGR